MEDAGRPEVVAAASEDTLLGPMTLAALRRLRADWGLTHLFGADEAGWMYAWRRDGTGKVMKADDPFTLRDIVAGTAWCCRRCLELVTGGGNSLVRAVHAETGSELCADGRLVAPVDERPDLRRQANEIEAEFPWVTVSARFGFFRADLTVQDPRRVCTPFDASTADDLRRQLAKAAGKARS